jgi:hypothetical protein
MDMIKLIDGNPVPYSEAAFRAANKHTVYGPVVSSRHLNAQGVYRVSKLPEPEAPVGKKAVLDAMPTQNEAGHWVLGWTLVALSTDEARALRDSLLAATDWTANSDVTMSDEMRTYRQALRDVPAQAGFPDDVTWPLKP